MGDHFISATRKRFTAQTRRGDPALAGEIGTNPRFNPRSLGTLLSGRLERSHSNRRCMSFLGSDTACSFWLRYRRRHLFRPRRTLHLVQGCDRDLVRPLQKRMEKRFEAIMLSTKVSKIEAKQDGIHVSFDGEDAPKENQVYDRVLVSIGRRPNGKNIGAELAGVAVDERGFIAVDKQMRTNVAHIFAIGDIVGQPMLAHKATHEGKVAAEVIAGHKVQFQAACIPSVAYTDPEIAWAGVTEIEAKAKGIEYEKASFPWAASGRAIAVARTEGTTKLIFDKATHRLIGAGIVGVNAGELLAEAVLAIEMGADAHDLGLTIHAHPTLSETVCFAAEMKEGTITDLYIKKR